MMMVQVPGLAVVIVGNRKDSQSYVGMKRKACAELGIKSFDIDLPEQASEAEVIKQVHELNANPDVHGLFSSSTLIFELFGKTNHCFEGLVCCVVLNEQVYWFNFHCLST